MLGEIAAAQDRLTCWLVHSAAPVWARHGVDAHTGMFEEELTQQGAATSSARRARVQPRQWYALHVAQRLGAQLKTAVLDDAWRAFEHYYRREDGFYRTLVSPAGEVLDDSVLTYDQAFVLLALAQGEAPVTHTEGGAEVAATRLRDAMRATLAHPEGGFVAIRGGPPRFLSNPHMHLLEACLAWMTRGGDGGWESLAGEIVDLSLSRFRLQPHGAIGECFDAQWRPLAADVVEPGHQFEWSWLLGRWGAIARCSRSTSAARELAALGEKFGVDPARGIAVNGLNQALQITDAAARLWPQTERLKSALASLASQPEGVEWARLVIDSVEALERYLTTPLSGLWFDSLRADDRFESGPSPASSLYHIASAVDELDRVMTAVTDRALAVLP